jgi:hypothetical protein
MMGAKEEVVGELGSVLRRKRATTAGWAVSLWVGVR